MDIVVIGAGYVGLVSAACFSEFGHTVTCVDHDAGRVADLTAGKIPIFEPGLHAIVARSVADKRLRFVVDGKAALKAASVVFIAVGTPSRRGDGHADLQYVYGAARDIAPHIREDAVVVTKSTVPVGTGDEIERILNELRPGTTIAVASNPEFLREGSAIEDFKRPDRIVVGTSDERARAVVAAVYRPLFLNQPPIMFTERRAAELVKYAANAFLAMKITYINEMADLCEATGVDVQDIARGIGLDNRIGSKFLHAGPGYGGSCFPKDTTALLKTAQDFGVSLRLIEATDAVNTVRKRSMARKVIAAVGGDVRGKTVALLGLTFKPNTDDMRDAPSLALVAALQDAGARIRAYDPEGMSNAKTMMPDISYAENAYACMEGADVLVLVTEWDQFRALDLVRVKSLLKAPIVVDLRNVYRRDEMKRLGFSYTSVGRPRAALAE